MEVEEGLERLEFFEWEVTLLVTVAVLLLCIIDIFRVDRPVEVQVEDWAIFVEIAPEFRTELIQRLVESADIIARDL